MTALVQMRQRSQALWRLPPESEANSASCFPANDWSGRVSASAPFDTRGDAREAASQSGRLVAGRSRTSAFGEDGKDRHRHEPRWPEWRTPPVRALYPRAGRRGSRSEPRPRKSNIRCRHCIYRHQAVAASIVRYQPDRTRSGLRASGSSSHQERSRGRALRRSLGRGGGLARGGAQRWRTASRGPPAPGLAWRPSKPRRPGDVSSSRVHFSRGQGPPRG